MQEAERLGGDEPGLGDLLQPLALAVEPPDPLAPVDAVEEPVRHEQQHGDRHEAHHRLELLAELVEGLQQRLGEQPREPRRDEAQHRADEDGPPQAALRAHEGGGDGGEDEHRLQALAEHEDGRVGDDRRLVRAVAQRGRGVAQRVVEDEARLVHLPARRALGDELREPLLVARAEPDEALDLDRQAGVERLQPPLRPELEERVRLQARLLGLLVLGRADRGLHPVERERDEVVVGLVRRLLPLLREDLVQISLGPVRDRLHLTGLGDAVLALGRGGHERPQGSRSSRDRLRARGIAPGQQRAQVGERGGRAGAERHGLLDLEVEVDLRPRHATVVLDRHEGEEAQELLGAARRLGLGEGRGGEAVQRARHIAEARLPRGLVALGARRSPARRPRSSCVRLRPRRGPGRSAPAGSRQYPAAWAAASAWRVANPRPAAALASSSSSRMRAW